jgi:hypothetical protein
MTIFTSSEARILADLPLFSALPVFPRQLGHVFHEALNHRNRLSVRINAASPERCFLSLPSPDDDLATIFSSVECNCWLCPVRAGY